MEIIREPYVEEDVYYTLDYDIKGDPGSGFTFPCDNEGNIGQLNEAAEESYHFCQQHIDNYNGPFIRKHITRYRHGATIKCDCGNIFELQNQYYGACQCENCQQWYNLFGQYLTDPEYWDKSCDF